MKIGGKAAGRAVRKVFKKEFLAALKKIGNKLGVKILQRTIVKYVVPLASIGIGATWNYLATKAVGKIAQRHFESRPNGKKDLNTATEEQLRSVKGIGPVMAKRIIAGRPYGSVNDLLKVDGIGPNTFKKLEPFLKVGKK